MRIPGASALNRTLIRGRLERKLFPTPHNLPSFLYPKSVREYNRQSHAYINMILDILGEGRTLTYQNAEAMLRESLEDVPTIRLYETERHSTDGYDSGYDDGPGEPGEAWASMWGNNSWAELIFGREPYREPRVAKEWVVPDIRSYVMI